MLSELPNIGKVLEQRLEAVGIHTPADLSEVGSVGILQRLEAIHEPGCLSMLYALEGALRGTRWHTLPAEIKGQLKAELKTLQAGD
ncbi:MAG: TfoX/Sxy family protein [Candidatus Marinimicrobia bacterium]|nr:TfoX/Sxy family protein [Candidatus Neomarinimicrobiota bacterium]MCF7921775.1 TfoX/Sxy family protein [Candidatus Neomarinimicrobiota bacterium]